jgi:hypothetical protein
LSYLHQKAIACNEKQELVFLPKQNSFVYLDKETQVIKKLHKHISFGFPLGAKGPPSCPKSPIKKTITFCDNKIVFYPDGTTSPGSVYLTDISKKYFKALTCPLSQVFFIRTYEYKLHPSKTWIFDDKISYKNRFRASSRPHSCHLDHPKQ